MNIANEQALQANRETMVSLAWHLAFGKWVDADQRRVFRVWTQVRSQDGQVTSNPIVAALTLEFSCSPPTAVKHLARAVDLELLVCAAGINDGRSRVYSISAASEVAFSRIFGWMPLIDRAVMLQRDAEPNDFNAGADLLPPEIYIDTRSDAAKKLLKRALDDRMKKISDAKKGVET